MLRVPRLQKDQHYSIHNTANTEKTLQFLQKFILKQPQGFSSKFDTRGMLLGWCNTQVLQATSFIQVIIIYSRLILLQATIIYDHIPGFSPLINGVTQQLHRWVKVGWEHPGYKEPPDKLSGDHFGFPARQVYTNALRLAWVCLLVLPSHLSSERAKTKWQISMDFVRGKKNLSSMDSHCYKYEGIKKKTNPRC